MKIPPNTPVPEVNPTELKREMENSGERSGRDGRLQEGLEHGRAVHRGHRV